MAETSCDIAVIGGGVVGAAIAYGAARRGARVLLIDGADHDLRASRANFGLVWVQSKGAGFPEYQRWTRRSADLWAAFAGEIEAATGRSLQHRPVGGLSFCLGDEEFEQKRNALQRMHNQFGAGEYECRLLDRRELADLLPAARLGAQVTGASYSPHDGDVDPLRLLRGLFEAAKARGVSLLNGHAVDSVTQAGRGFAVMAGPNRVRADKVVVAAGHGSPALAASLGLHAPLRAERGQILVTERLAPFLPMPASGVRQTVDGTVMVGVSNEAVGFDLSTTVAVNAGMASRAVATFPDLARAAIVRAWAGLRILSPDGAPIYAQSESHPGAFLASCHSGISLAAAHASILADGVVDGALPEVLRPFHPKRFSVGADVQAA